MKVREATTALLRLRAEMYEPDFEWDGNWHKMLVAECQAYLRTVLDVTNSPSSEWENPQLGTELAKEVKK